MFEGKRHPVNLAGREPKPPGLIPPVRHNRANLSDRLFRRLGLQLEVLRDLKRQNETLHLR